MLTKLRTIILEEEFKMIILNNRINIVNYTKIIHFDNIKIIIADNKKKYTISGSNLVISKLLIDELLIEGNVEKIEIGDL